MGAAARTPPARPGRADQATVDKPPRVRDRYRGLNGECLREGWGERHKAAARGVAGVPGHTSAEPLQAKVAALGARLKKQPDRAQRRRRRARPTGHGPERPLGMPVSADKRRHAAGASSLKALAAPACLACREGYRPARGAGEAVRDRTVARP